MGFIAAHMLCPHAGIPSAHHPDCNVDPHGLSRRNSTALLRSHCALPSLATRLEHAGGPEGREHQGEYPGALYSFISISQCHSPAANPLASRGFRLGLSSHYIHLSFFRGGLYVAPFPVRRQT